MGNEAAPVRKKLVIVGDSVGKTSLLLVQSGKPFSDVRSPWPSRRAPPPCAGRAAAGGTRARLMSDATRSPRLRPPARTHAPKQTPKHTGVHANDL